MDIIREASVEMCVRLAAMLGYHGRNIHPRSPEDVIDNRELASDLESILTLAKMLDCDSTIDEIGRELPTVRQATITDKTRAEICDSVFRRFAYDLALPLFLRVPRIRAERAFQRSRRFGDGKVLERWPELKFDVECALFCWALSQPTASVFHLMRIVETGLRDLAKSVGARIGKRQPTWNDYIVAVENKLKPVPGKKLRISRARQIFLSASSAHMRNISQAWRNPLVHELAEKYDDDEATLILDHIEALMQRVAENMPKRREHK